MQQFVVYAALIAFTLPALAEETGALPITPPPFGGFDPVPLASPSHTDRFVIDANQSYVKAYIPVWERVAGSGGAGGGFVILEAAAANDDTAQTHHWELNWQKATYALSGFFDLETVYSEWDGERSRLYVRQSGISTDAPAYAGFALPWMFAQQGQQLDYSSNPCFDGDFANPPGWNWSCSGWEAGPRRADSGSRQGASIAVSGAVSDFMGPWGVVTDADTPEPPDWPIDYSAANGLFEYHMVAITPVPEPGIYALLLAGLAMVGIAARRRGAI